MAGLSGNTTLYSSAIQYVIFLVTTGIILPYIDRVGRRTLLLIGAISSLILHFTIAGVMATQGHHVDSVEGNDNLKWEVTGASGKAVIALSYIFVGVYGFTWAPVGWIYCSEVFPLKYRAKGVGKGLQILSRRCFVADRSSQLPGLAAATNWAFNFALAYFVAPAFKNIQWSVLEGCNSLTFVTLC
jgi:MFS family permease